MCGIVALLQLDGAPADPALLAGMGAVLRHRGPDDEGLWVEGPVGFAHRRLSIIDLHTGHQPMEAGPAVITYNGELYNYLELRRELEARGRPFRTTSDTEVILQAWLEWGEDCVTRFNGMFAFVLWDRGLHRLFAARDHFGIKPLYLWQGPGAVALASEIKALLRHPALRAEADAQALIEYVTFQYVLDRRTLFRGVEKLLPGERLSVDAGGTVRRSRFWEPHYELDLSVREAEATERLRALMQDAVRLQMRSDVPVGTYLSGGMDSSFITMEAARLAGTGLRAYNGVFREGPDFDESGYARLVARAAGVELCEVAPTEDEFIECLPRLIYHLDEPAAGPGVFPQYVVARRAAADVKVLLGGQGGDEIFGGYARYIVAYLEQALKGAIFETNEEGEHIVSLQSIVPNLPLLGGYGPMMQQFWRAGLFEPMDQRYFRLLDRNGGAVSVFTPGFRAALDQCPVFERFQEVFHHPRTESYFNKMTNFDLAAGLPALLQVEDRVSMAVSLESRVPLLDHRVVDLVTSLPPALRFRGAEMKYIFKRAARGIVPAAVLDRKDKMGFPVPLHLWARGRCREFIGDLLLAPTARTRDIYDPAEVARLMDYEAAFSRQLWGMLNLELWFRTFLDHRPDHP